MDFIQVDFFLPVMLTQPMTDTIFVIIWLVYYRFITYATVDKCSRNMQTVNKNSYLTVVVSFELPRFGSVAFDSVTESPKKFCQETGKQ